MPRVADSNLRTRLVRTYEADPADPDPNVAPLDEAGVGTINFKEGVGGSGNFTRGFVMSYQHTDSNMRLTIIPWVFDPTSGLWFETAGVTLAEPRKLFIDPTIGDGIFFFQGTKTAGGVINVANPLTFHAGAR